MSGAPAPPTQDSVLASLSSAADAARQSYMNALTSTPAGTDLSQLYAKEMAALNAWSSAEDKALANDPAVAGAQGSLDAATKAVRNDLSNFKDVATSLTVVDNLVKLATTLSGFFA
ncbi:hypothetical protein [Phenylobacterium sp.]|uniref:hypothetical protein n=1 Tax=Phenylobacterium sp. TaxID=1871053 RepID=UPI002C17B797|nr:hypothetical protein [Phenylobacterium sp.]HLZ77129.1 hypothetical protein [Phenylobacterium sp.]